MTKTLGVSEGHCREMKVYHIVYEPSFKTAIIYIWTQCNLLCRGCYCQYEKYDFRLVDDVVKQVATRSPVEPPTQFLSLDEVMRRLQDLDIDKVLFIGTEPSLDPELPALAKALHDQFHSYNVILTNGVKLTDLTHIDEVVFSLKAYSEDIYRDFTGKSNRRTLANFATVYRSGTKLQAECLLIPGYIDAEEVERIAKFVASRDKDIKFRIDGYFPVNGYPWRAATAEDVNQAVDLASKYLNNVSRLTLDMEQVGDSPIRIY